jgi:hypothetical protein
MRRRKHVCANFLNSNFEFYSFSSSELEAVMCADAFVMHFPVTRVHGVSTLDVVILDVLTPVVRSSGVCDCLRRHRFFRFDGGHIKSFLGSLYTMLIMRRRNTVLGISSGYNWVGTSACSP